MERESLIGYSLSRCVKDIITNRVPYEAVRVIIAATQIQTPEDLTSFLDTHADTDWNSNPKEGIRIAKRLFAEGKVEQPRLTGGQHTIPRGNGDEDRYFYWTNEKGEPLDFTPQTKRDSSLPSFTLG